MSGNREDSLTVNQEDSWTVLGDHLEEIHRPLKQFATLLDEVRCGISRDVWDPDAVNLVDAIADVYGSLLHQACQRTEDVVDCIQEEFGIVEIVLQQDCPNFGIYKPLRAAVQKKN